MNMIHGTLGIRTWVFMLLGLAFFVVSQYTTKPFDFYDISVVKDRGEPKKLEAFPFSEIKGGSEYVFRFHLDGVTHSHWQIIPDNLLNNIKINGQNVDLSEIDNDALRNWSKGFQISLFKYLHQGKNEIEIQVRNFGGPAALKIIPQGIGYYGWFSKLIAACGFVFFCLPIILVSSVRYRWVFFVSCVFIAYYNTYTSYLLHGHDVEAHIEYVQHLIEHVNPPPPFGGWEFHQPPLYYYLVLPFYWLGEQVSWLDKHELIQYFSAYLMVMVLYFSCRIFRLFYPEEDIRFACCILLMCFWPSIFIHASRVGNDIVFYLFAIICFYYICRWWLEDRTSYFVLSAVFCALAIMSKSSGIILVATAGSLYLIRMYSSGPSRFFDMLKLALLVSPILLIGFVVSFGDSIYYKYMGSGSDALLGTSINSLNGKLFVDNEPRNYLIFDIQTFLMEPFALPWEDKGGRDYFWNYFLKSSLFGEFTFHSEYHKFVALMVGPVCLLIVAITLLGIIKEWKTWNKAPLLVFSFFSILAVIVFRASAPASPHSDFRFVLPVLCCFFVYFSQACDPHRYFCWVNFIRISLSLLIAFLSILFFTIPG